MSSKSKKQITVSIPEFRPEDMPLSCTFIVIAPPAGGKCLGRDTPVLLHNGSIAKVQDIKIGDVLMGDDSGKRDVLSIARGKDKMYKVVQSNGDNYECNEAHILCLKRNFAPHIRTITRFAQRTEDRFIASGDKPSITDSHYVVKWMNNPHTNLIGGASVSKDRFPALAGNLVSLQTILNEKSFNNWDDAENFLNEIFESGEYILENIVEMTIKDYIMLSESEKVKYKGYKVGVEFEKYSITPSPWLTAFAFGCKFTGADKLAVSFSLQGMSQEEFDTSVNNETIPLKFLINDRETRLNFLAGLIDSCIDPNHINISLLNIHNSLPDVDLESRRYFIKQKSKKLSQSIEFLARSLGFNCYTNDDTTVIYGLGIDTIPVTMQKRKIRNTSDYYGTKTTIKVEYIGEGDYYGFQISGNGRFVLGDFTVTHNTTFMENMAYYRKHLYGSARIILGTPDGYKRFCKIFHPLFVSNSWDEKDEERHVLRQKTCVMENGKSYPGNYAINIIDDVGDDPKIYKTKLMRGLFKLGSQHWSQLLMVGSQYAIDMPPDVRKSVSYVAIGREPEMNERKKLYDNFGGLAGSFERFCDLMDQITGDYTFLIFNKRSQSNELEDCVSWFKTRILPDWKFGSKEYRKWAEDRYNKSYVEEVTM